MLVSKDKELVILGHLVLEGKFLVVLSKVLMLLSLSEPNKLLLKENLLWKWTNKGNI